MQGAYGGLVVIMIYSHGGSINPDNNAILTETGSGVPILTETSDELITEQN